MTSKDYKLIAETFNLHYEVSSNAIKFALRDIIDMLGQRFQTESANFDKVKFDTACGIKFKL